MIENTRPREVERYLPEGTVAFHCEWDKATKQWVDRTTKEIP
jgi:hypothetical protein